MSVQPSLAAAVPNLAGMAILLLGLLLPLQRRRAAAARLVAVQGGLLAVAAGFGAWGGAGSHLWLLALGAVAGRALPLPMLLRLATLRPGGEALTRADCATPAFGAGFPFAGGGLALLSVAAVVTAGGGMEGGTREGLALALATLLAGLLAAFLRRGVLFGLLGLLAAENGALLGLVHAGGDLPGAAVLAVLSPGLVACIALALLGRGDLLQAMPWAGRR